MKIIIHSIFSLFFIHGACLAQSLSIPDASGPSGGSALISVSATGFKKLSSADLEVKYDSDILSYKEAKLGAISVGGLIESNEIVPGVILLSLVDGNGISDDGVLIFLSMNVNGKSGKSTDINITGKSYNNELIDITMNFDPGKFTVTAGINWMKYLIYAVPAALIILLLFWLIARNKKKRKIQEEERQKNLEKRRQERSRLEQKKTSYTMAAEEAQLEKRLQDIRERKKLEIEEKELEKRLQELRDKKNKS